MSDHGFELVEPFIVCASNGGPYDDHSFVAGVHYGRVAALLSQCNGADVCGVTVPDRLVPQLDLHAMQYGKQARVLSSWPDWAVVDFVATGTQEQL